MAPTVMWGKHARNPHRWTQKDVALAMAYHIHTLTLCPDCGHPTSLTYNDFNAGEFELKDDKYCLACEVRENHKDDKREAGQKQYIVNHIGEPRPDDDRDDLPGPDPYEEQ